MNLKKYNQLLVAVLGTAGLLGAGGILMLIVAESVSENRVPRILIADQEPDGARIDEQELLFCSPSFIDGSGVQLIPVAVRNLDEDQDVRLRSGSLAAVSYAESRSMYYGGGCRLSRYGGSSRIFNVIVRSDAMSPQRLLLDEPAQIDSLTLPHDSCVEGEGSLPCGMLLWLIRDRDSNGDGAIDDRDALVAFHSDLQVTELRAATPADVSVVSFSWDSKRGSILYLVRTDRSGEGTFDGDDSTELLEFALGESETAARVVAPEIRASLEERIR